MKHHITIFMLLIAISLNAFSQDKKPPKFDFDKFKAEKIAFITEAIDLTPEEAQAFWPIYNECEKKKWELIKVRHDLEHQLQEGIKEMSDTEYKKLAIKFASSPIEDGKLNVEYNNKYLEILPPKKVLDLYVAEMEFRGKMLRNYRDKEKDRNEKPED